MASCLMAGAAIGPTGAATGLDHRGSSDSTPNARVAQEFAAAAPPVALPAASAPPAPAPPALDAAPPLQPHEIFAFAPWWNLSEEAAFDVKDMTTLAYFSVGINPDGTADQSDSGWTGYQSQALADLVTRAHAANDRVVLTATCFDQQALDQLTSDPAAPSRLAATLIQLVSAKNLDGVNFDFEGRGARDRQGLDTLIGQVTAQLRVANPHWQITVSTYASSAGDPSGFFDVAGLAPVVDGFFVMAYDMNDRSVPSPTAPLTGPGNNDTVDVAEYAAVVPRSKIILGVPYYGYDWPTTGPQAGAAATGPPTPVSYAQVASLRSPEYWDRASQTPWTAYQVGPQWHQVYFDDPTSLALKARLANGAHIGGIGVWALGMDGNDRSVLAALLGNAKAVKYLVAPTTTTTTSTSTPTTTVPAYHYGGTWNGSVETLQPVDPSTLAGGGAVTPAGTLTAFTTDDPRFSCLSSGSSLAVSELEASPTTYLVTAATPGSCVSGTWTFTIPAGGGSGTGPSSGSTTTTTVVGGGGTGGGSTGSTTTTSTTTTTASF